MNTANIWLKMRAAGLREIDRSLEQIEQLLIRSELNIVEVLVLEGRCRELRMARWLIGNVPHKRSPKVSKTTSSRLIKVFKDNQSLWSNLHTFTIQSLGELENQTPTPLEIDILKQDKKRELIDIILQEFALLLEELQNSEVDTVQLLAKMPIILSDLWRTTTTKFLGKYYTLNYEGLDVEIVHVLIEDRKIVEAAIIHKIPLAYDLFNYLIFQSPLVINNTLYEAQTPEAIAQAQIILHNLVIQIANAVMQPLLNHFADVEEIKQKFYDYRLIPTRELERFRNNLSWHYRLESYWGEAQAIYESRFYLFTFTNTGIKKVDIYASRRHELVKLSGIPFLVTLLLELQDAIAPRLRSVTAFIGTGLVYLLKNVVGKGIGLIGKGILQGIGDSFSVGRRGDRL